MTWLVPLLLAAATPPAPVLRAGVARVEITPAVLGPMYGYANRKCGPATGTHDPLHAKVLVLEAGATRMAIVTLDLGSVVSFDLKQRVAERLGIPVLLLAASHTHSAPSFPLPGRPGDEPARDHPHARYLAEVEAKVFDALARARRSMFPARLGVGRGQAPLGYNRLLVREDGRARALFDNLDRVPHGPLDPEVTVLRVDDAAGRPRAVLVQYAVHPVVLGPSSCKYSADYPGVLQARLEAALEGAQAMFVLGGAGDVNPLFLGRKGVEEEDFATMEKMGELLAAEALRAARAARTEAPARPSIAAASETLTFRHRWDPEKSLAVGITTVLLNGEIAIATVPGEPHHRLQTYWKQAADARAALFFGYTHDGAGGWPGYIPDLRNAAHGGYGADVATSIEVGAGEAIMERHRIALYGLRGMWRPEPGRP